MQNIPYLERLRQLNLERLDVRRLRADLILAYKILFGITGETDISQFFTFCDNLHNTRGHQFKLLATRANRDTRNYFLAIELFVHGTVCHRALTLTPCVHSENRSMARI